MRNALVRVRIAIVSLVVGIVGVVSAAPSTGGFVLVTEWGELGGSAVAKIDPATDQIIARASISGSPRHIAADRARRLAYVSLHYADKIAAIRVDTMETADVAIPGMGRAPIGVTLTPDGTRLLVATRGSDGVVSADDRLDIVALDPTTWPPTGSLVTSIATGLHPIQAIVDRNGRFAVVTVRNQPAILVVNLATGQVVWQAPGLPANAEPEGGCAHPVANMVYVALHGVNTLEVLDLDLMTIVRHVPVANQTGLPTNPSAVRFTPDGSRAYVSGQTANRLLMFDTSDPRNPLQDARVELLAGPQPHDIVWLPGDRAYVANTNNMQAYGSLSVIDGYSTVPVVSGPILSSLAGPLSFAYFDAAGPAPSHTIDSVETWVAAPDGNQLYARIVQPVPALYPGQRFPALIAIPGGTGPGAPLADNANYRRLAASGFVVVVFNPEGRGTGAPGNLRSEGSDDCNGFVHQDDLKAIIEHTAALPNVRVRNIGVETSSLGIAIGAGALGRYPALPVAYLVDQEGPHDNRVITFYDVGRETAVCGHLSTVTDPSPANQAFWAEREAVRHIGGFPGMYLRMQSQIDHAQGLNYFRHTLEMIDAATRSGNGGTGSARWTRVNGSDLGNPIDIAYATSQPTLYPAWIPGRLADHPGLNLIYDVEMSMLVDAGDLDADGDEDAEDANLFDACFTGPDGGSIATGCERGDFDLDGDVDCVDWNQFVMAWTQPGDEPVLAACAAPPGPVAGLLLSRAGANFANLGLHWSPVGSAVRYAIYSDHAPNGPFTDVLASGVATTTVALPMPVDPVLYIKVVGVNLAGVEGPK